MMKFPKLDLPNKFLELTALKRRLLGTVIGLSILPLSFVSAETVLSPLKQAERNIEKYRKGSISIQIKSETGVAYNGQVEIRQQTHDFKFGSIVFELTRQNLLTEEQTAVYKQKFSKLFNMAIFPFYWDGYEYQPGHPVWEAMEGTIDWCLANGIRPKGHPLAWTHIAGTPKWLYDLPVDHGKTLLKSRIIENILGYKNRIDMWDIANETVNTVSWETALKDKTHNNNNRYGGYDVPVEEIADWVAPCYEWGRAANPDAEIILNDFGQIAFPEIRQRFFDLVKVLQKRDTPLDGIGLQAHEPRLRWYSPDEVWETLEMYKVLNLPIHFTEFHPHSSGAEIEGDYRKGSWSQENQAEYAEQMMILAFGHPSVVSFSWWDFTENDSFIKGSALLNNDYSEKPAYKKLDELINSRWKTKESIQPDENGHVSVRGFYGDYQIRITEDNGSTQSFDFSHNSDEETVVSITLD